MLVTRAPVLVDEDALLARLTGQAAGSTRSFVAIAGPPGSGKSTLAETLLDRLEAAHPGAAAILPMDGFHYDDSLLHARGWRSQKGAPHTFDVDGLDAMLKRLGTGDRPVAVPVFDRALEISRAGARIISETVRLVIVEGNYLLLQDPAWRPLQDRFDLTVMVETATEDLRSRLMARWADLPPEDALRQVEGNDLPNARLVMDGSCGADLVVRT